MGVLGWWSLGVGRYAFSGPLRTDRHVHGSRATETRRHGGQALRVLVASGVSRKDSHPLTTHRGTEAPRRHASTRRVRDRLPADRGGRQHRPVVPAAGRHMDRTNTARASPPPDSRAACAWGIRSIQAAPRAATGAVRILGASAPRCAVTGVGGAASRIPPCLRASVARDQWSGGPAEG